MNDAKGATMDAQEKLGYAELVARKTELEARVLDLTEATKRAARKAHASGQFAEYDDLSDQLAMTKKRVTRLNGAIAIAKAERLEDQRKRHESGFTKDDADARRFVATAKETLPRELYMAIWARAMS